MTTYKYLGNIESQICLFHRTSKGVEFVGFTDDGIRDDVTGANVYTFPTNKYDGDAPLMLENGKELDITLDEFNSGIGTLEYDYHDTWIAEYYEDLEYGARRYDIGAQTYQIKNI